MSEVKLEYLEVINPCKDVKLNNLGAYSLDVVTFLSLITPVFEDILDIILLASSISSNLDSFPLIYLPL